MLPSIDADLAGFGHCAERFISEAAVEASKEVALYAKLASRPLCSATPLPKPAMLLNNKPAVRRTVTRTEPGAFGPISRQVDTPDRASRRNSYKDGAFCPVEWQPAPESVLRDRARHLVWWCALRHLAVHVASDLTELTLLPPAAPQCPWLERRLLAADS